MAKLKSITKSRSNSVVYQETCSQGVINYTDLKQKEALDNAAISQWSQIDQLVDEVGFTTTDESGRNFPVQNAIRPLLMLTDGADSSERIGRSSLTHANIAGQIFQGWMH